MKKFSKISAFVIWLLWMASGVYAAIDSLNRSFANQDIRLNIVIWMLWIISMPVIHRIMRENFDHWDFRL